jgi:hypothetical protein
MLFVLRTNEKVVNYCTFNKMVYIFTIGLQKVKTQNYVLFYKSIKFQYRYFTIKR